AFDLQRHRLVPQLRRVHQERRQGQERVRRIDVTRPYRELVRVDLVAHRDLRRAVRGRDPPPALVDLLAGEAADHPRVIADQVRTGRPSGDRDGDVARAAGRDGHRDVDEVRGGVGDGEDVAEAHATL